MTPPKANASLTTSSMNVQQSPNHPRYATQTDAKSPADEMALGKAYLPASDSTKSGMVCGSPVAQGPVKKVDQADIRFGQKEPNVGSVGDVVKACMDSIANTGGPRAQMRGQRDSKNYNENGKAFDRTSNSPDSDAGN
jgi:hypothetical protein